MPHDQGEQPRPNDLVDQRFRVALEEVLEARGFQKISSGQPDFRVAYHLTLDEEVDYQMVVPIEELTQRRQTQRIFNTFLFLIAAISLLVGGIGIANIMLSTVTERTREIGIRRALGAKRRHIMQQFLTETVTVSVLGGLVGVMFGYLFSWGVVEPLTGYDAIITRNSIVLSLGISMVVGVLSGIYPARRAARLDPISALRHE